MLGDVVVDRDGVEGHDGGESGQTAISEPNIPGGENPSTQFTDRDDRYGEFVGQRRLVQWPPRLAGDKDGGVDQAPAHRGRSLVVSGARVRQSPSTSPRYPKSSTTRYEPVGGPPGDELVSVLFYRGQHVADCLDDGVGRRRSKTRRPGPRCSGSRTRSYRHPSQTPPPAAHDQRCEASDGVRRCRRAAQAAGSRRSPFQADRICGAGPPLPRRVPPRRPSDLPRRTPCSHRATSRALRVLSINLGPTC
jgi:hypothetical protein